MFAAAVIMIGIFMLGLGVFLIAGTAWTLIVVGAAMTMMGLLCRLYAPLVDEALSDRWS